MFSRKLANHIIKKLPNIPAIAILGPRQVGKTTLALEIARGRPAMYLDLENQEDVQKLSNPTHYFGLHANKLVILDEVQRYPDLFMSLRGVIDAGRQQKMQKQSNGRFLILGSASHDLLQQSSESLAGRIHYLELSGLSPLEIESTNTKSLQQLWIRGGFPDSYLAANDAASHEWRRNFIKTYVERDIPQLGARIAATTLIRFWTMLAHIQGELFNASKLASSLGVESVTVSRYLDLMVDLLLVRKLAPWFGNVKKRLVKSPRIYIRDSGILHALLHIPDYEYLLGHPILGKSWEGFVIENILTSLPSYVQAFFYRTAAGAEIDLLLEWKPAEYWAIEIKASRIPKVSKGFYIACEDLAIQQKFVIYPGEDTFLLSDEILVMSLPEFLQKLASTTE